MIHGPGEARRELATEEAATEEAAPARSMLTRSSSSGGGRLSPAPAGQSKPREEGTRPGGIRSTGPGCMIERGMDPGPTDAAQGDKRKASAAPSRRAGTTQYRTIGGGPGGPSLFAFGHSPAQAGGMIDAGRIRATPEAGTVGPGCILYQSVFGASGSGAACAAI